MSRNIKLNTTYMKTLSKQNTDMQLDFDLSSFQTSNNFFYRFLIFNIYILINLRQIMNDIPKINYIPFIILNLII